jgi:RNA polymerase sigma-70 factor (ECF subfamily)
MARRDLTPASHCDFPAQGGGRAATVAADGLDAALGSGLARLRQVALRITHDPAAADDVLQNAVEKALRHRERFRGEARASTWLHRIVVNEALMWYRGERRRGAQRARLSEALAFAGPEPGAQALDALLARERRERVRRALGSLRPEDAGLLAHVYGEERGYASWARRTGMRASAAKTRAFRARRALRAALEAADPAQPQQQPPSPHGPRVSR